MAYQARARKRVFPVCRGPDGSAFQNCVGCGASVAIALINMHECGSRDNFKKIKRHNFEDLQVGAQKYEKFEDPTQSHQEFEDEKLGKQRFQEFQEMGFKEKKFEDQPRSAFCFFMEEFMEMYKNGNQIEVDRMGFETWKKLSIEERLPYVLQEEKVNCAYTLALHEEEHQYEYPCVDVEADSSEVGKFRKGKTAAKRKSAIASNNILFNFIRM